MSLVLAMVACCGSFAQAAVNTFTTGTALSTNGAWSMYPTVGNPSEPTQNTLYNNAPTSGTGATSYQDAIFQVTSGTLTINASNFRPRSMNVSNGSAIVLAPVGDAVNVKWNLGPVATYSGAVATQVVTSSTTFVNGVSGGTDDVIYLANNSSLRLSSVNATGGTATAAATLQTGSSAVVNFNVAAGSTFTSDVVISGMGTGSGITVKGGGLVVLGAAKLGTTRLIDNLEVQQKIS